MGSDDAPLEFVGSSYNDLKAFPPATQRKMGAALRTAQEGRTPADAKVLQGFRGAGVLELVSSDDGNAYRCVYTVRLIHAVYVLHCFQKKSTRGIKTTQRDIALIRRRLADAEASDAQKTADNAAKGASI